MGVGIGGGVGVGSTCKDLLDAAVYGKRSIGLCTPTRFFVLRLGDVRVQA